MVTVFMFRLLAKAAFRRFKRFENSEVSAVISIDQRVKGAVCCEQWKKTSAAPEYGAIPQEGLGRRRKVLFVLMRLRMPVQNPQHARGSHTAG
jgi:hypothetical protein